MVVMHHIIADMQVRKAFYGSLCFFALFAAFFPFPAKKLIITEYGKMDKRILEPPRKAAPRHPDRAYRHRLFQTFHISRLKTHFAQFRRNPLRPCAGRSQYQRAVIVFLQKLQFLTE